MTILNTLKLFGMGILGGTLPLATYVIIQHNATNLSDQVIDGNRNAIHQVDFNGVPSGLDFTSAAENTVHSVVHITTKVVQTTFQRDPFQEFFMALVLAAVNSNNMALVLARASSYLHRVTS